MSARPQALRFGGPGGYLALNLGFVLLIAVAAASGGGDNPRAMYLCLLFAICSSPLLFARSLNGPHVILIVCLPLYFLYYGVADLLGLFVSDAALTASTGVLSAAEIAVLLGGLLMVLGYNLAVAAGGHASNDAVAREWPDQTLLIVGLSLWVAGIAANWFWASEVVERHVIAAKLSPLHATTVIIGRYLQPMAVALIAYKFVKTRGFRWSLLIICMLLVEFAFGFIADSKEQAIRGSALVLLASHCMYGRTPKTWLIVAALVVVVAFPVFQAYRFEVLQQGGQTRAQGAQNIRQNLKTALSSGVVASSRVDKWSGIVGRLSLKPTMELLIGRVGQDVPYQNGYTIQLLVYAFIPRIVLPDKPDTSVGRLFNRQFQVSADPDTYISPTTLGEMYWNFGWAGIILGMSLVGFLLGYFGSRFSLAEHRSLTRFLLLAVTVYFVCLRFEGGIAVNYTQWIRSVAMVLLLHLIFARGAPATSRAHSADEGSPAPLPNLMR